MLGGVRSAVPAKALLNFITNMTDSSIPSEWQTHAEKTNYRETPSYAETISFSKRLADSSSAIDFRTFGLSGQRRELPLLIASEAGVFSPQEAKEKNVPVVLIQA